MSFLAAGEKAPAFELAGADGKSYSLSAALARGPLLAAFFKVSCPICQYTFPFVERIAQQIQGAGGKNVQVWGVSQDSAPHTQNFAKEFGVTFPLLIDPEPYEISREYKLTHVPTLFLIAPTGKIEISGDGFSKGDLLDIHKALSQHLSVKPAALFNPVEQIPAFRPG